MVVGGGDRGIWVNGGNVRLGGGVCGDDGRVNTGGLRDGNGM